MGREFRFRLFVRKCCDLQTRLKLVGDRDLFAAALETASERYDQQSGGTVTDFLSWLLDHADEIIALILKIIELFA